mmetsp:Transcript_32744/g.69766  ORF Transcript_32744/g.69766 Transcript_32744/m.69766 type:complete len:212 (+) Transcript_32744:422-1057(+)
MDAPRRSSMLASFPRRIISMRYRVLTYFASDPRALPNSSTSRIWAKLSRTGSRVRSARSTMALSRSFLCSADALGKGGISEYIDRIENSLDRDGTIDRSESTLPVISKAKIIVWCSSTEDGCTSPRCFRTKPLRTGHSRSGGHGLPLGSRPGSRFWLAFSVGSETFDMHSSIMDSTRFARAVNSRDHAASSSNGRIASSLSSCPSNPNSMA